MSYSFVVISGGASRRFAHGDKALSVIDGKSLVEHCLDTAFAVSSDVIHVSKTSDRYSELFSNRYTSARFVNDLEDESCALNGIITGLKLSRFDAAFILSVDMPLFPSLLCFRMYERYVRSTCAVLAPNVDGVTYATAAFYGKEALAPLEASYSAGRYRLMDTFSLMDVDYIDERFLSEIGVSTDVLTNINTVADLEKARAVL